MNETHVTLVRNGVPTRFDLPPFTDTVIRWYGLDFDGEFIQTEWERDRVAAWRVRRARWQRFERRSRWLRRLGRPGEWLSRRLAPPSAGMDQSVHVHDCMADHFEIVGTRGLVARNLTSVGGGEVHTLQVG